MIFQNNDFLLSVFFIIILILAEREVPNNKLCVAARDGFYVCNVSCTLTVSHTSKVSGDMFIKPGIN